MRKALFTYIYIHAIMDGIVFRHAALGVCFVHSYITVYSLL